MGSPSEQIKTSRAGKPLTIASIALGLRIIVALLAYARRDLVSMLWPRGVEALGIARSLVGGSGFSSPFALPTGPTAFLPPVYPLILAGIERVFGVATPASAWAMLTVQCIFSALTCIAIYFLTAQILDERIANRAAWIWALFPYAMILPTNIIWESSLSALMLTVGLLAFVRSINSASQFDSVLLGAFWALACLVNAAFLLLLPTLLIFHLYRNRTRWSHAALCVITFLVFLTPWSVRNYVTFHRFFPLRDNFALELWVGTHEGASIHPSQNIHPAFNMAEVQHYQQLGEIGYMAEKHQDALRAIKAHPLVFAKYTIERFLVFWLTSRRALWLMIPIVSVAGLISLAVLLARSHPLAWILWIPLAIYPLPYYITHADLKYQHPVQPLLVLLCAYGSTRRRTAVSTSLPEAVEVGV